MIKEECEECDNNSWKAWAVLFIVICIYNCVELYCQHEIEIEKVKMGLIEEKEDVGK